MLFKKFGVKIAIRVFHHVVGAWSMVGGSLYLETFSPNLGQKKWPSFPIYGHQSNIFFASAQKKSQILEFWRDIPYQIWNWGY